MRSGHPHRSWQLFCTRLICRAYPFASLTLDNGLFSEETQARKGTEALRKLRRSECVCLRAWESSPLKSALRPYGNYDGGILELTIVLNLLRLTVLRQLRKLSKAMCEENNRARRHDDAARYRLARRFFLAAVLKLKASSAGAWGASWGAPPDASRRSWVRIPIGSPFEESKEIT